MGGWVSSVKGGLEWVGLVSRPNFLALCTGSNSNRHLGQGNVFFVHGHASCYYAFFAFAANAEIQRLHSKFQMSLSAEFDSKQSHEIGPMQVIWDTTK